MQVTNDASKDHHEYASVAWMTNVGIRSGGDELVFNADTKLKCEENTESTVAGNSQGRSNDCERPAEDEQGCQSAIAVRVKREDFHD